MLLILNALNEVSLSTVFGDVLFAGAGLAAAQEDSDGEATVEEDIGKSRDGSRTDDEAVQRLQELRKY